MTRNSDSEKLISLYDSLGKALRPVQSATGKSSSSFLDSFLLPNKIRLLLISRLKRAERELRENIFNEAFERDRIAREYKKQHVIAAKVPKLGTQSARYAHLNPLPRNILTRFLSLRPPVVIIGGLSNDIDPLASLGQEAALNSREVIILSYPESVHGSMSSSFVEAVEEEKWFAAHAQFFMQAITELFGNHPIEIWGYSTGCPIIAEMLNKKNFSKKVQNAVFICPAATVNQSRFQFLTGLAHEAGKGLRFLKLLPNYSLILPNQSLSEEGKKKIFNLLFERIQHKSPYFETAHVMKDGDILVLSAQDDQITKSFLAEDELKTNAQIRIIKLEKAVHLDPLINARDTVQLILAESTRSY